MSLYDRVAQRPGGGRALASARLRRTVTHVLDDGFRKSGIGSRSELARRLGIRKSAVSQVFSGDGNVRVDTLAAYLWELGFELDLTLIPAGEHRRRSMEGPV